MGQLVTLGVFPQMEAAVVIPLLEAEGIVPVVTRESAYRTGDVVIRVGEDDLPRAMRTLAQEMGAAGPAEEA